MEILNVPSADQFKPLGNLLPQQRCRVEQLKGHFAPSAPKAAYAAMRPRASTVQFASVPVGDAAAFFSDGIAPRDLSIDGRTTSSQ
jgi:hypothetical protein